MIVILPNPSNTSEKINRVASLEHTESLVCIIVFNPISIIELLQEHKGVYRVKLVAEVSQTPEEEEVVPHIVQLISPPFLGRTVLTAGPAKFGMDLTKQEHGVSSVNQSKCIHAACLHYNAVRFTQEEKK